MISIKAIINNETGLHARPATQVVTQAAKFKSSITFQKKEKSINAKSIMGVLSLGLVKGDELIVTADGEDEAQAVALLKSLIEESFSD